MVRLVRATHDLRIERLAAAAARALLAKFVIMGRPDKPGDDDQEREG
jgi:hypothetical protein